MLDAGLQLEQALHIMGRRRELSALKDIVASLLRQVREGVSFSAALRSSSKSFSDLYCNLVAAGELSGSLSEILKQQARYLKTMEDLRNRVIQALIYPSFIFSAGIALLIVFMTMLVPQLKQLFAKTQQEIPFTTQFLIAMSQFIGAYWWLLLTGLLLAVLAAWQTLQYPGGRLWWDRNKLQIPLFGPVMAAHFYAQFAHTLANLISNGIPLHKALTLVSRATPNVFIRGLLERITDAVGEGALLSRSMDKMKHFPPLLMDMIAVGEQTGELGKALNKIAQRYDKELDIKIQRLTTLIQPVIIVLMAIIVGTIVYSILRGIFQAIQGIHG